MSSRATSRLWITAAALAAAALPAAAQYQGQVDTTKNAPELRAVGVLEWAGVQDHPESSRLIPICVFDGQDLEDASVYMARPAPLALQSDVEYQLLKDGRPVGLYDVEGAGQQMGSWIGFGKWRSLPGPKPPRREFAKVDEYDDAQSDEPVLHRGGDAARRNSGSGGSSGTPTLHKGGDASNSGSNSGSGASDTSSSSAENDPNAPPPDPDRPILHADTGSSDSSSAGNSDSPKPIKKNNSDEAYVSDVTTPSDPNRPHLFRGKTAGYDAPVLPSLVGLPPDMHQEVAVSDATDRPVHVWSFSWSNPADELKMKADLEGLARTALGLNPPPALAAKKTSATRKSTRPASPPPLAPLLDEQFRVFELAYGSGATMVLSAHTAGGDEPMKFVMLIAQPDLYGNVAVLLKNVADASHLDDTPRMKLIDAVDARADNRGELLFELRGATQRQFALYRVLRGDATRIFLSSVEPIGVPGATGTEAN